jgi:excisionase family DNA binding protein
LIIIHKEIVNDGIVRGKNVMYKNYDDLPVVLGINEIRDFLGIGRDKAYELLKSNEFHVHRFGNRTLVPRSSFIEWFEGKQK